MNDENKIQNTSNRRGEKRERKKERKRAEMKKEKIKKTVRRIGWSLAGIALLSGLVVIVSRRTSLPSTSTVGHIERSPESQVLDRPMDPRVFAHMLEHANGSGPPGVVISYNCEQFDCESGFVNQLAKFAYKYPNLVYVAPYKNMSEKLVLSANGRQKIMKDIDEQGIIDFIERRD